jgi:hypothetical protein
MTVAVVWSDNLEALEQAVLAYVAPRIKRVAMYWKPDLMSRWRYRKAFRYVRAFVLINALGNPTSNLDGSRIKCSPCGARLLTVFFAAMVWFSRSGFSSSLYTALPRQFTPLQLSKVNFR